MSDNQKLTDNEKCATFIGWKRGDGNGHRVGVYWCHTCNRYTPDTIAHLNAAPDMSKPENYMRAIAALVAKYGAIQLTLVKNGVSLSTPGREHEVMCDTWTETLAALYQAEHPS